MSGALSDCIAAGLPTVASRGLCEALDSPSYVYPVEQKTNPLLVAEQLARIYRQRGADLNERKLYLETHNADHYAKRLLEVLNLIKTPEAK